MEARPLIVIVGPTASGKTALAIKLASQFDGEIICADSRTVYRGMDIGTAKPTLAEQQSVKHWGIDLVDPNQRFSAADFKAYAVAKIADIRSRRKTPFLVGGTGLYIDSIIFDYQFGAKSNESLRAELQRMTIEELVEYCKKNNIELPQNDKNKRYIIRSIEQNGVNTSRKSMPIENAFIVGITTEANELRTKIALRAEQLLENGVIEEAKSLSEKYGWNSEAMTGNIYPLCKLYLEGQLTKAGLTDRFITLDRRLAKRQLTWLRRNHFIKWYTREEAEHHITSLLASIR